MKLTLKQKLIGASLSAVVVMATALTWLAASQLHEQTQNSIFDRADSLSKTATKGISDWIHIRSNITGAMKSYIEAEDPVTYLQQARDAGGFVLTYFGTPSGNMVRSNPERNRAGYDPRVRPWYISAQSENKPIISEAYHDALTNALLVTLAEPVKKNGQLVAVVGSDVLIDQMISDVISLDVGENAYAMLLNTQDNTFLAHPNKSLLLKPINEYDSALSMSIIHQAVSTRTLVNETIKGKEKLLYFTQVPGTPWILGLELDKATEEASQSELLTRLILASIVITLAVLAAVAWLVGFLFRDLGRVSEALAEIATGEGDLTQRLEPRSDDEVGQLAHNFNRFVGNMHGMVMRLRDVSQSLNSQAHQTASQAEERSTRIRHQQDEINMVATAINEMAAATQEISGNADNTARTSTETVQAAEDGAAQVEQSQHSTTSLAGEVQTATGVIGELNHHAQSINTILSTIQNIAEQTNLLALNAAIEAARAGEQGRGFAVVADEVRVLSQRTHASTQEIQQMIETLQQTTGRAVGIMDDSRRLAETSVDDANSASASLTQIISAITNISDMATQIASAAEEQSSVTSEITRNTEGIRDVSNELAQEATEAAQQAAQLSELSHELQQEISRFKL
ncbi:methyl-accepting chemotaxis protein [Photobacterium sp. 1_MG-2023]|uniref:methyl-accepting chemotaxis protein n=1 Tax=Photobacterium sp. 1_MG-2023 TaxID=3062646 RepID=UPI0026E4205A|nr:methyl-accepting chemotaxis protein [Photobacterium sp. 1_MG-2023]MDO6708863.1 methyl-accepting chemotaxis protein [Photobacterium sp. 1_MG-2023]